MTIIVYQSGECWSDDLIHSSDLVSSRQVKMVWRPKDGAIISAAGDVASCQEFGRLALAGKEKQFKGGDTCIPVIFKKDGLIQHWRDGFLDEFTADYYAIGSGRDFAIGAILSGANAKQACGVACLANGWQAQLHGLNHEGHWSVADMPKNATPHPGVKKLIEEKIKETPNGKKRRI